MGDAGGRARRQASTSVGDALTGRGGDIKSEPKRTAVNEGFGSTLLSRLNQQKAAAIIIVAQRVHADDLVGFVLENSREDWAVLSLPAIAPADAEITVAEIGCLCVSAATKSIKAGTRPQRSPRTTIFSFVRPGFSPRAATTCLI